MARGLAAISGQKITAPRGSIGVSTITETEKPQHRGYPPRGGPTLTAGAEYEAEAVPILRRRGAGASFVNADEAKA